MSDSIQEQLLALGLAQKKPRKKHQAVSRKREKSKSKPTGESAKTPDELSLAKAYALRKHAEQKQAGQARKKKLAEDRQRRLLNNGIKTIVRAHRLNQDDAEIARNFMFKGRIRKINVTEGQLKALNAGELGIAYVSGGYHLLANEFVETVGRLSAEHVVDFSTETGEDGDHPVPDDA